MSDAAGEANVMSLLAPEDINRLKGLPPVAIAAAYNTPQPPDRLAGNPSFLQFMHNVIARYAPAEPTIQTAAQQKGEGQIYLADANSPQARQGTFPPEDIIGVLNVKGGRCIVGSYAPNPNYLVFRRGRGLVRLPGPLHEALLNELRSLPPRQ